MLSQRTTNHTYSWRATTLKEPPGTNLKFYSECCCISEQNPVSVCFKAESGVVWCAVVWCGVQWCGVVCSGVSV